MLRMPRLPADALESFVGSVVIGAGLVIGAVLLASVLIGFAELVQWVGEWR